MRGGRAGDFCKIAFLNRQHMCAIFRSAVQYLLWDPIGPATFHIQDEPVAQRSADSLSFGIQQQKITIGAESVSAGGPGADGDGFSPFGEPVYFYLQAV